MDEILRSVAHSPAHALAAQRPGAIVQVWIDGETRWEHVSGCADVDSGELLTKNTTVPLASLSKQFVGMATALCVESGLLRLDDPLEKYVPGCCPGGAVVRLRHLLHHTSGIRDYVTLLRLAGLGGRRSTGLQLLELIRRQPRLNFAPGTEFCYSSSGYLLLSLAVERATRVAFRDFCRRQIFAPLSMSSSAILATPALPAAKGHLGADADFARSPEQPSRNAAVVYSTARDMKHWNDNWSDPQLGSEPDRLICFCQRPGRTDGGTEVAYAAGWYCGNRNGHRVLFHRGQHAGYDGFYYRVPDLRISVLVLSNYRWPDAHLLGLRLVDRVMIGTADPPGARRSRPSPINDGTSSVENAVQSAPTRRECEMCCGEYYCEEIDTVYRVVREGNGLVLVGGSDSPREHLLKVGPNLWMLPSRLVRFVTAERGNIVGLVVETPLVRDLSFSRQAR